VKLIGYFFFFSSYNVEEMTYALKTADAKFLMTHPNSMEVAVKAAANAGIPKENLFLLEGSMGGHTTIKELIIPFRRGRRTLTFVSVRFGGKCCERIPD
jgi:4-coumarate--CoA ligase